MFNEDTTNLIDYAYQDNGTAFRDSLYNAIHDKVSAHIEAKKQEIAAGLMGQQEEYVEESKKDDDDDDGAYDLDDPKHPTWAKRYLEKADSKRKSDKEGLKEGMYADGKWHVIDNANGGYYKNSIHSTHETARKAINAARKANADAPHEGRFSAASASSIKKVANEKEVSEGVAGDSTKGTCLASSSRPSIFSAKANKEFDRVKNLSDKDSKYYHDTQIRNAQLSQRLRMGLREDVALEEGRKPSLITGTRKIASYEGDHGHTAEVRHSREYNEYQVHHYKNGVHQGEGPISYHGDDKEGAHDNAKYEVGMQPEIIKKK